MFEERHLHVSMHAKQPNIKYRIYLETQRSSFPMYIYFKQYILVLLLTYKEGVVSRSGSMIRVVFHTYGILHETLRIRIQIAQRSLYIHVHLPYTYGKTVLSLIYFVKVGY